MILGKMTKDCELKFLQNGTVICSFSIAYNERRGDKDVAMFFDVTAFGKIAENINKYFSKGSRILIGGSLDYQSWEKDGQKRSKVGIKVNGFDFIDRKSESVAQNYATNSKPVQTPSQPVPEININETFPF